MSRDLDSRRIRSDPWIRAGALCLGLLAAALVAAADVAPAEKRLALVIGNARYPTATLNNPEKDARVVAIALRKLGFEVSEHVNLTVKEFRSVLRQYSKRLQNEGAVALFYYAGHGVQIDGKNYLLPVDINLRDEDEVKDEGVDIDELFVGRLERVRAHTRIVILDACRDNPFGKKTRTVRAISGLAEMDANGALIAYSAAPGKTAEDGPPDTNSAFTRHLAREMLEEDMEIEQMLKKVRIGVLRDTQQRQMTWHTSSLTRNFFFNPKARMLDDPRKGEEVARLKAALEDAQGQISALKQGRSQAAGAAANTAASAPLPASKPALQAAAAPAREPDKPVQAKAPTAASRPLAKAPAAAAPEPVRDRPKAAPPTKFAEAKPSAKPGGARSEKCVDLLTQAQLGEPVSAADMAYIQKECR